MILNDKQIKELAEKYGMINPFVDKTVGEGVISYGLSSFGYDIRLHNEFYIFKTIPTKRLLIDPKRFNSRNVVRVVKANKPLIIKSGQYVLGRSVEFFKIPEDVFVICVNKSTYARCGLIVNISPLEPCYSEDTEVLTNKGWKYFYELEGDELVLTLNKDFEAEYKPIERIQKYPYFGKMIGFNHREINLLVTPEHKMFVGRHFHRNGKRIGLRWETLEAEKMLGWWDFYLTRQVNWKGRTDHITVSWKKDEWFLKFLGAYLGDGSSYVNKGGYLIKLAVVSKERKREVFREILTKLSYLFNFKLQETEYGFSFYCKDIFHVVNPLGHAKDKYIPREFLLLPPEYLQHIWYGLLNSDGTLTTETYTTSSKMLADDVQELIFKMGFASIVRKTKQRTKDGKEFIAYKIRKTNNTQHKLKPWQMFTMYYKGFVYDLTAKDNHVIFVRRNGRPVWSGNCWRGYLTIEIANPTTHQIAVYPNEGIAQLVFFRGERPEVTYEDRKGVYQNQLGITFPRVRK